MAQLQNAFNAQQFDPTQGGGLRQLPKGKHPVVITASDIKAAKTDEKSGMIVFGLQAIDGPAKGQEQDYRLNLYNASDAARTIAEKQLAALCYVTGVFMVQDTQQLHGIPFVVEVTEQPLTPQQLQAQSEGKTVTPFTQVARVYDIAGNEPGHSGAAPAQAAPAPAAQPPQAAQWAAAPATPSPAPAPAPAAAPAAAWGQPAAAAAPAAAGWQQGAAAGGKPAWAK